MWKQKYSPVFYFREVDTTILCYLESVIFHSLTGICVYRIRINTRFYWFYWCDRLIHELWFNLYLFCPREFEPMWGLVVWGQTTLNVRLINLQQLMKAMRPNVYCMSCCRIAAWPVPASNQDIPVWVTTNVIKDNLMRPRLVYWRLSCKVMVDGWHDSVVCLRWQPQHHCNVREESGEIKSPVGGSGYGWGDARLKMSGRRGAWWLAFEWATYVPKDCHWPRYIEMI